jgi:hypothetical protein
MQLPTPPSDVPEFGRIEPEKRIEPEITSKPDTKTFESLMEEKPPPTQAEGPSPMQLSQAQMSGLTPTFDSLIGQVSSSQTQLNSMRDKLNTPNLTLKNSHQKLLDSKLSEANNHLQRAAQYMGAEEIPESKIAEDATPIAKFLGYLTDGQNRLELTKQKLQGLSASGTTLQPGEMMLIQINLAQAQQEIEFSSVLLSKVTDALKQILTIQL